MVKIFLNSNLACGYCLDLNNCTKRWNCTTVKNEQLNESFSNYTHLAYTEQQWNNNSRDSSAVSWSEVVTKSHPNERRQALFWLFIRCVSKTICGKSSSLCDHALHALALYLMPKPGEDLVLVKSKPMRQILYLLVFDQ